MSVKLLFRREFIHLPKKRYLGRGTCTKTVTAASVPHMHEIAPSAFREPKSILIIFVRAWLVCLFYKKTY